MGARGATRDSEDLLKRPTRRRSFRTLSMVQLGRRISLIVGGVAIALIAGWLWLSWNHTQSSQLQRMGVAVGLTAGQAENFFSYVDSHLQHLAEELVLNNALSDPLLARERLLKFAELHPDLGGASIILPDGLFFASTALDPGESAPNIYSDPAWGEDFRNNLQMSGLSINRVQMGYLLKKWLIPLRYTVRDHSGNVAFVLQTALVVEKQQALWRNLAFPMGSAIGLLRDDGYLVSRYIKGQNDKPELYTQQNLGGALFLATQQDPAGGIYKGGTADGSVRYGAYQRLARYPIYAFYSLPRGVFVEMWWQSVRLPLYLILATMLLGIGAYHFAVRRFGQRMLAIEASLASGAPLAREFPPSSGIQEIDMLCLALAKSKEELRRLAHNREKLLLFAAEAGTYAVRRHDDVVIAANQTFLNMLGRSEREVLGQKWRDLLIPQPEGESVPLRARRLARRVIRMQHRDGSPIWVSVAEYQDDNGGEVVRYGLAINVTEREHLLETVRAQSGRLKALWQLATDRTHSDDEKIEQMLALGRSALHMETVAVTETCGSALKIRYLGDTKSLLVRGQEFDADDALCRRVRDAQRSVFIRDLKEDRALAGHPFVVQSGLRVYAGTPIWVGREMFGALVFLSTTPAEEHFSEDDQAFMELLAAWLGQTILQARQQTELRALALTDSLTKLPNRRAAEMRLGEELARAQRESGRFAVAICDLDRFKLINDQYGHDSGDRVLIRAAELMSAELREGDWLARWGGEEFLVYLHGSDHKAALAAMERVRRSLKAIPVTLSHGCVSVTTSVGIGLYRGPGQDIATILSEADGCLYEAKNKGRDCVMINDAGRAGSLWKAGMLQQALQEDRVTPAYQTIVDLKTGRPVADEALARLVEPDGRIIPAGEFVDAAEGIHLIQAVDQAILRKAMHRCAVSQSGETDPLLHFINVSPQFLSRRDLIEDLLSEAQGYCTPGSRPSQPKPLVFEITERQFVGELSELRRDLQPLIDFGFRLALDDFGSGYSSFLYLAELPVSFLKIEGWMIRNMITNPRVYSMVQSIVLLAQHQGITTIAECIEDEHTADLLREMGVDWGQGYYFGRPECPDSVGALCRVAANTETLSA